MVRELENLAKELGIADGGLLKLAREISHDGNLVSIRHMRKRDQEELLKFLEKVTYQQQARELVGA